MLPVSKRIQEYYGRGDKPHYRLLVTYDDGKTYVENYFAYKKAAVPDTTAESIRNALIDKSIRSHSQPRTIMESRDRQRAGESLLAVVKEYAPKRNIVHLLAD